MADKLSTDERGALMSRIRSKGNRSTEARAEEALQEASIGGWEKHPPLPGKPDFYFPHAKLAVFIDGCFWHGCPQHRQTPVNRAEYWQWKLEYNRRRDRRVRQLLRRQGYHIMRVWEHDLKGTTWVRRLRAMLRRLESSESA